MLDSFSVQAVKIIEDAKKIANQSQAPIVGTEHLLLAMYQTPDSICHFLLQEENITLDDLNNILSKMVIIHKMEHPDITFTSKFQDVVLGAKDIALRTNSEYVFDEHLFYSLLCEKDSIGHEILIMLNVNTEEMLHDIEEIFSFFEYKKDQNISPYPFLVLLSNQKRLHPFVKRKDYIERIIYILSKKQKNNPLLIGNAGVGKTAIVEGLCDILTDETIYQLDLGSIVAGTKYRGELEEKLVKAMEFVREQNAIVFIDEIHNIVGAGSNDGSLDIANILKPYLSRSGMRLIGATTLDEYYHFIEKDKALMRRFQNIFIDEPSKAETFQIIKKIKHSYEEYHHVQYSKKILLEIIRKCDIYLKNRNFPDKAIDVLDEIGARANKFQMTKLEGLVDKVIADANGIMPKNSKEILKLKLYYLELVPYYLRFIERVESINNIATIKVEKDFNPSPLLTDLEKVFAFKKEMYLEIDLENYYDPMTINNLIGSSKGYVGYEQGGILTEHLLKYPFCVIYFKNAENAHLSILNYLEKLFKLQYIIDNKGRKIYLSNSIFIMEKNSHLNHSVGFDNKQKKKDSFVYDVVLPTIKELPNLVQYQKLLNKYQIKLNQNQVIKLKQETSPMTIYQLIFETMKTRQHH